MTPEEMTKIQDEHIAAENRRDVEGAVATYHENGFYENVALGLRFEGKQGIALQYAALYFTFPDAEIHIDGRAYGEDTLVEWGTFSGTMTGDFMGLAPTGRRLDLPIIAVVPFRDGLMFGERVYFDAATVCDQLGLDLGELRAAAKLLQG